MGCSRNVKFLLDTRRIDCFVDVHSYSELVLYPWRHVPTQTTDSTKRFTTLPTGTCTPITDPGLSGIHDATRPATVPDRRAADRDGHR
ncbi:MAG: M14 family zinc carboxypeptidase [Pseudonocardiales bacterium]